MIQAQGLPGTGWGRLWLPGWLWVPLLVEGPVPPIDGMGPPDLPQGPGTPTRTHSTELNVPQV